MLTFRGYVPKVYFYKIHVFGMKYYVHIKIFRTSPKPIGSEFLHLIHVNLFRKINFTD